MIKPSEVREMSQDQMKEKLVELHKELFNLRFQNATRQLENTAAMSQVKKDIARLYTISREQNMSLR